MPWKTSMIDISDGLSSEIMHLCKQSKVGCNLYEDKLPCWSINVCENYIDSTTVAINGGYELLFTIAMEFWKKETLISIIGHMTQKRRDTSSQSRH
jgi:thiamine-monophosphate kinase